VNVPKGANKRCTRERVKGEGQNSWFHFKKKERKKKSKRERKGNGGKNHSVVFVKRLGLKNNGTKKVKPERSA